MLLFYSLVAYALSFYMCLINPITLVTTTNSLQQHILILQLKSRGGTSIPLQFVDQDKLEAAAIEADRLGALAYGRPHAFTFMVIQGSSHAVDI